MPVGVLDSGVGGLSVVRAIRTAQPHVDLIYYADQAHLPYGPRPAAEIRQLTEAGVEWLLAQGCEAVVLACNTASAAALQGLREAHPRVPFVGMEPAIKPAAAATRSGVIGVLATPGTLRGELFRKTRERHAAHVRVIEQPCAGWVEQVEGGELAGPAAQALIERDVAPLLAEGADALVLGCTHFPFLAPLIAELAGPAVRLIDPAPAVAAQLSRILGSTPSGSGHLIFHSTGDSERLAVMAERLLGGSE